MPLYVYNKRPHAIFQLHVFLELDMAPVRVESRRQGKGKWDSTPEYYSNDSRTRFSLFSLLLALFPLTEARNPNGPLLNGTTFLRVASHNRKRRMDFLLTTKNVGSLPETREFSLERFRNETHISAASTRWRASCSSTAIS